MNTSILNFEFQLTLQNQIPIFFLILRFRFCNISASLEFLLPGQSSFKIEILFIKTIV